jgi:hypothetical protein
MPSAESMQLQGKGSEEFESFFRLFLYLRTQYKTKGLKNNANATYLQEVPTLEGTILSLANMATHNVNESRDLVEPALLDRSWNLRRAK